MKHAVPFYSNTPDDIHCYQAAIKMVAKYFWPDEEYSWEKLEKLTAKVEGLWTWPTAGLLWLQSKGATVVVEEGFDWQAFAQQGEQYLLDFFGKEVGTEQIKYSNISQEVELVKTALKKLDIKRRKPDIFDVTRLLDEGFLVICNVNSNKLNNKKGYVGHFIVVIGHEDNYLILHDPGLPPLEDRVVTFEQFNKAWAYPNDEVKNIMGIKHEV